LVELIFDFETGLGCEELLKCPMYTALTENRYSQVSFYTRLTFLKNVARMKTCKSNVKLPFKTAYFLGVRKLTTSSYMV
jgi:hypothetical protein